MLKELDQQTALVLIDLQKGILRAGVESVINLVLENATELIASFRKAGLPVVIVHVEPAGAWLQTRKDSSVIQNIASLASAQPDFAEITDRIKVQSGDVLITKKNWNAFFQTQLHDELHKRGVTGIVLGGVSTSAGVESTARSACELGYNIAFASDAMTDRNMEAHDNSVKHIFPRLGEVSDTRNVIDILSART